MERILSLLAPYIGFTFMKRYWPVRGSYWNRKEIDKTSIVDLQNIIEEVDKSIHVHIATLTNIVLTYFGFYICDYYSGILFLKLFLFQAILQGYILLFLYYNSISASQALIRLPPSKNITLHSIGNYYCVNFNSYQLTPYTEDKVKAKELKGRLRRQLNTLGFDSFARIVFLDPQKLYREVTQY